MKETVRIEITGRQRLDNESDETKVEAVGHYEKKKEVHRIEYDENAEDGAVIHNTLRISPHGVKIEKRGALETDLFLVEGKTKEVAYKTPYGILSMETCCESVRIKEAEEELAVKVKYRLLAGGALVSDCETDIRIKQA